MTEYMFGSGDGWLKKDADKIAQKHGAMLCNYTDPQCRCGYGCPVGECKSSRRHWFAGPNLGEPFNQQMADAVLGEIERKSV